VVAAGVDDEELELIEELDEFEVLDCEVPAEFVDAAGVVVAVDFVAVLDSAASWPMTPTRPARPPTARRLAAMVVVPTRFLARCRTAWAWGVRLGAWCAIDLLLGGGGVQTMVGEAPKERTW
jgi:hypothetical protein